LATDVEGIVKDVVMFIWYTCNADGQAVVLQLAARVLEETRLEVSEPCCRAVATPEVK
jgi:hypothetical protein